MTKPPDSTLTEEEVAALFTKHEEWVDYNEFRTSFELRCAEDGDSWPCLTVRLARALQAAWRERDEARRDAYGERMQKCTWSEVENANANAEAAESRLRAVEAELAHEREQWRIEGRAGDALRAHVERLRIALERAHHEEARHHKPCVIRKGLCYFNEALAAIEEPKR